MYVWYLCRHKQLKHAVTQYPVGNYLALNMYYARATVTVASYVASYLAHYMCWLKVHVVTT